SVKEAVNFIGAFEKGIVQLAREAQADGVVCGHIHTPAIHDFDGVAYFNCGDWVESRSALVEHADGRIELIRDFLADAADVPQGHEDETALVEEQAARVAVEL